MDVDHVALWTSDLEKMKDFYVKYFQGQAGVKYVNQAKGFESYFLAFASGGRLEIMRKAGLSSIHRQEGHCVGYAHMAFSVGTKEEVDALTNCLHAAGHKIISGPRTTGDGYYESCFLDPDGNEVEITVGSLEA